MNRALLTLMVLNQKAVFRRTLRGLRTVRGIFFLLFTLGFVALMIGPQIVTATLMSGRPELRQITAPIEMYAPMILLLLTFMVVFTSAGEAAIYFTPAEVDFLFSAPFTRRELLLYKLAKTAMALLVMSTLFSLMLLMYFRFWPAGFLGVLLALAMVQLVGMVTTLVGQMVAQSAYTRARRIALLVMAIAAMTGLSQAAGQVEVQGLPGLAMGVRQSPAFRVLLAPFEVFTRVMFADRWFPEVVGWGAAALAIDAALVALLLRLDANYIETAATISQKVYERIRRAKQGGGLAMPVSAKAGKFRLAPLPWLAGAGPMTWRQVLIVLRTSRHMLLVSMGLVGMAAAGAFFSPPPGHAPGGPPFVTLMGIGMTFYLTFLFSMQLPWAFRGDLDHIEFLKTLPVRPTAVAAGELTGGILILTAIQLALFAILTAAAPAGWTSLATAAAFCLPFNALLLAVNNFLFLLYPVRQPAGTTFDVQAFGKMMLFFTLQFLMLLPMVALPMAMGGAAYLLAGWFLSAHAWEAFLLTSWLVLVTELVPLFLAVAWAFVRFDVSTQTPA